MVIAVIGAQWGDEGKGKIVDLLAERFDIVVRYQGGHNAGHSVQIGNQSFVLHLLPSGIVHEGKTCVLGNGMVIDPKAFFEEADRLMGQGITVTPERVKVSSRAHLILPYHRALDHTSEERLGNEKVGTTLRGIGPAYEDKAGRRGIRVADAMDFELLRSRIERNIEDANLIIRRYRGTTLDAEQVFREIAPLVERLGPFITDTTNFINNEVREGRFPTEMLEGEAEIGQLIRERGHEYGVSTGRPRRCGWFDAFATRYAADINGFDTVALTKLDILDTLDEIKVCTSYRRNGKTCDSFPAVSQELREVEPVYETLPGWKTSTEGVTELDELPRAARDYVRFISERIGVSVGLVSTGPERGQTILVRDSALSRWLEP